MGLRCTDTRPKNGWWYLIMCSPRFKCVLLTPRRRLATCSYYFRTEFAARHVGSSWSEKFVMRSLVVVKGCIIILRIKQRWTLISHFIYLFILFFDLSENRENKYTNEKCKPFWIIGDPWIIGESFWLCHQSIYLVSYWNAYTIHSWSL